MDPNLYKTLGEFVKWLGTLLLLVILFFPYLKAEILTSVYFSSMQKEVESYCSQNSVAGQTNFKYAKIVDLRASEARVFCVYQSGKHLSLDLVKKPKQQVWQINYVDNEDQNYNLYWPYFW